MILWPRWWLWDGSSGGRGPATDVILDYDVVPIHDIDWVLTTRLTLDYDHNTRITLGDTVSSTADITIGPFALGSVQRLLFTLEKDGAPWTGITAATLLLEKPDRTTRVTFTMTLVDDTAGQWVYQTTIVDLDTVGEWTATVEVIENDVVKKYPYEIGFTVTDTP